MNETPLFHFDANRNGKPSASILPCMKVMVNALATFVILIWSSHSNAQNPRFCAATSDTLVLSIDEILQRGGSQGDTIKSVSSPDYGTSEILNPMEVRYVAPTRYFPIDSFIVDICSVTGSCQEYSIIVEYVPEDQVFTRCDYVLITKDSIAKGNALYNDLDFKGSVLVLEENFLIPPQNGNVVIDSDGLYTYTPNPGFLGEDYFSILCCTKDAPRFCQKNRITVQVIDERLTCATALQAVQDCYSVGYFGMVTGNVLTNDINFTIDAPEVKIGLIEEPKLGTATIQKNGDFTYTHENLGYASDAFKYEICIDLPTCSRCDTGEVMISLNQALFACQIWEASINDDVFEGCINQSLIGNVSSNDLNYRLGNMSYQLDPEILPRNGQVSMSGDGYVTFSPNSNWTGTDRFGYLACFGNGYCARATAYVTIMERVIPQLRNDTFDIGQQGCVELDIFLNDYAIDGYDVTSFKIIEGGNNGQFNFVGSQLEYCPDPKFIGYDTIKYELISINSACQRSIKDTGCLLINRLPFLDLTADFGLSAISKKDHIQLGWRKLPYCDIRYATIFVNDGLQMDTIFLSKSDYFSEKWLDYRGWEQGTELIYKIIATCADQTYESQWVSVEVHTTEHGVFYMNGGYLYFSRPEVELHDIQILSLDGRVISNITNLNGHRLSLNQGGVYIISYRVHGKIEHQKLFFNP